MITYPASPQGEAEIKTERASPFPTESDIICLNKIVGEGLCAIPNKRSRLEKSPYKNQTMCLNKIVG